MGRLAATHVMRAYTYFWDPQPWLEHENAEAYLMRLARAKRMDVRGVAFDLLPSVDCIVRRHTRQPCVKMMYSCLVTLPPWSPPFCMSQPRQSEEGLRNWTAVWPKNGQRKPYCKKALPIQTVACTPFSPLSLRGWRRLFLSCSM